MEKSNSRNCERQRSYKIYHQLSILLNERDEAKFRVTLQAFLTHLQTEHARFFAYFTTNYCSRLPQWAACYRTQTTINTNMYLESFHRVLKILYLNHKQNRRIDSLLITLMRVARDKELNVFVS